MLSVWSRGIALMQFGGKRRGLTEGQGSPTEFDLDVIVATVILLPVLTLPFSCACSFALSLSLIEALRIHADVVLLPHSCPFP